MICFLSRWPYRKLWLLFIKRILPSCTRAWFIKRMRQIKVVKVVTRHAFIWKCDLIDITTMAVASGSQRTLDGRLLNQAKAKPCKKYGLFQVSNAHHRADLKLGPLGTRFRDSVFYTFASLIPSDPALASTFARKYPKQAFGG